MRRGWAVGMILTALFVVGCGEDAPDSGTVKGKQFEPAHDDSYYTNQCISYNKNGTCSISIPVEHTDHIPDRYELLLENCSKNGKGELKCKTGWHRVTAAEYDRYASGQHYPDPQ